MPSNQFFQNLLLQRSKVHYTVSQDSTIWKIRYITYGIKFPFDFSNGTHVFPTTVKHDGDRDNTIQAGYQIGALAAILAVSVIGGIITG